METVVFATVATVATVATGEIIWKPGFSVSYFCTKRD